MNKRISTLLTAGLLMVGALFGSANAAPTAEAAKGDLQNGAKFYLGNTNGFIKVDQTYKVNGGQRIFLVGKLSFKRIA